MWAEVNLLSKITPRFWAHFAGLILTPELEIGNIERYLLCCCSFLTRRNSVLSAFSFSLFISIQDWTEAKHHCKPFSAAAESSDAKYSYISRILLTHLSIISVGVVRDRCPEIMLLSGVIQRVKSRGPRTDPWGTSRGRSTLEDSCCLA